MKDEECESSYEIALTIGSSRNPRNHGKKSKVTANETPKQQLINISFMLAYAANYRSVAEYYVLSASWWMHLGP